MIIETPAKTKRQQEADFRKKLKSKGWHSYFDKTLQREVVNAYRDELKIVQELVGAKCEIAGVIGKNLVSIGLAPTDNTSPDHQMPPKKSQPAVSQYSKLDGLLLDTIRHGRNPLYDRSVSAEAGRIAKETGREEFRVTDARLQALRKAGQIQHLTKAEIGKEKSSKTHKSGWRLVEAPKPAQGPAEEDPTADEDSDAATESSRPTA